MHASSKRARRWRLVTSLSTAIIHQVCERCMWWRQKLIKLSEVNRINHLHAHAPTTSIVKSLATIIITRQSAGFRKWVVTTIKVKPCTRTSCTREGQFHVHVPRPTMIFYWRVFRHWFWHRYAHHILFNELHVATNPLCLIWESIGMCSADVWLEFSR